MSKKRSITDVPPEELREMFPFDPKVFLALSSNDGLLYEFINKMAGKEVPYVVLFLIYGGKKNEPILCQQLVRLLNRQMIYKGRKNNVDYFGIPHLDEKLKDIDSRNMN